MSKITYEEYVEAAKMEGFEIEFTEEDFDALSEEQLDELKASTKLSYINKASRDRTFAGMDFGKANTDDERKAARDRMRKRGVGISKAATSLAMKASNYDAGLKKEEKEEDEDEKSEKKEKKHSKKEMSESAASDTLKPFSKHADSRTSMMASVVSVMGGMPKKDLVKWFDQTMSQFGPNKDYGVGDNSAKNKASIAMKAVKEDVAEMFSGEELSEDFKEKASVLFEAAVNARLISETARLEEEYEEKLNEEIESVTTELTEKLDVYLDYVAEQWMKENEVAIETSLRNELVDDFMESLKNVFAEHYIDVPQDKLDVLEALSEKVASLEEKLDEMISENVELKKISQEVEASKVFDSVSEGLALTQVDRFRTLAEGIEFDGDMTAYEKKLNIIKEAYFTEKTSSKAASVLTETFEEENTEVVSTSPEMKRWAQAISRTVKK